MLFVVVIYCAEPGVLNLCFQKMKKILCLAFLISFSAGATHIRGGEITARRISNLTLTYEFTFTGFRDQGSVIEFGDGIFDFGDNETNEQWDYLPSKLQLGNNMEKVEYKIVHTYSKAGTYIVSYRERNRNDGIANMDESINTAFYVESKIVIDPFLGLNDTPIFTVPPIDQAYVGQKFVHYLGAFDYDGDSLSYEFIIPQDDRGVNVENFRDPNDPEFYQDNSYYSGNEENDNMPTYTIDAETGLLVWDAPGDFLNQHSGDDLFTEYNVAIRVFEWRYSPLERQWYNIGYITRDMQIVVNENSSNRKPEISEIEDIIAASGENVKFYVSASDPDGDRVKIEALGGPFHIEGHEPEMTPNTSAFEQSPAELYINWSLECGLVRSQPYEIYFKVTDNPSETERTVNFSKVNIQVVGAAPKGLSSTIKNDQSVVLNWDKYNCIGISKIQIWRRPGSVALDDVSNGMPVNLGYQLIDEIDIFEQELEQSRSYHDQYSNEGFIPGTTYSYRVVGVFSDGARTTPSPEVTQTVEGKGIVMKKTSIEKTHKSAGAVKLQWSIVGGLNSSSYSIYHMSGDASSFDLIAEGVSDSSFLVESLNTMDLKHSFKVTTTDVGQNTEYTTPIINTVSLQGRAKEKAVKLNWQAEVPWSNVVQQSRYHYVWRNQVLEESPEQYVMIDSVNVIDQGFEYLDDGRFNATTLSEANEYCYFVTTIGTYGNPSDDLIVNNSQQICVRPYDVLLSANTLFSDFTLYPNPGRGSLTIESNGPLITHVRIVSLAGKSIFDHHVKKPDVTLNLRTEIPVGTYLVQAFDVNQKIIGVKRFVIVE